MCNYPELKEYASTYFRINKKITEVKNALIKRLDLLYPGISSMIDNLEIFIGNEQFTLPDISKYKK